jgi:hypothetical protein
MATKKSMSESSEPVLNESPAPYRAAAESALGLEFPDWSGHRSAPSTLGMDEMLRYCEAMLPHVRSFPSWRERRLAGRCRVEFRL